MFNQFIKYLNKNIPSKLQISTNYFSGELHSITINFDSDKVLGQFTAWHDLKSTSEFIQYETGEQLFWHCSFNQNIDELINELELFIKKAEEYSNN